MLIQWFVHDPPSSHKMFLKSRSAVEGGKRSFFCWEDHSIKLAKDMVLQRQEAADALLKAAEDGTLEDVLRNKSRQARPQLLQPARVLRLPRPWNHVFRRHGRWRKQIAIGALFCYLHAQQIDLLLVISAKARDQKFQKDGLCRKRFGCEVHNLKSLVPTPDHA